ncbi:MAG: hypothetical protein COA78_37260 [Blastopirellula sp.]|nr:MAG: hypothetical protein COA78_37260 [Blastopirellula sp.]
MFKKLTTTTLAAAMCFCISANTAAAWDITETGTGVLAVGPNIGSCGSVILNVLSVQILPGPPIVTEGVLYRIRIGSTFRAATAGPAPTRLVNGVFNTIDLSAIETQCDVSNVVVVSDQVPIVGDSMISSPGMNVAFEYSEGGTDYLYRLGIFGATASEKIAERTLLDSTSPIVTLSGAPATLNSVDPFNVTVTFDEDVTGFDNLVNDITITNASVTAIAGGPSVYTLTVSPTGSGDVSTPYRPPLHRT